MEITKENIDILRMINKNALIDICKANKHIISGYWDMHKEDILDVFERYILDYDKSINYIDIDFDKLYRNKGYSNNRTK